MLGFGRTHLTGILRLRRSFSHQNVLPLSPALGAVAFNVLPASIRMSATTSGEPSILIMSCGHGMSWRMSICRRVTVRDGIVWFSMQ